MSGQTEIEQADSVRLQLRIKKPSPQTDHNATSDRLPIWHPTDQLEGFLSVQCRNGVTFESLVVHLEGYTRIWTNLIDVLGKHISRKATFKFLVQSQETFDISRLPDSVSGFSDHKVPFNFVISSKVVDKEFNIPDVCLNLPPSFQAGRLLRSNKYDQYYAQPSISYQVRAQVTWRSPNIDGVKTSEILQEVIIRPYTEEQPPTHTHDFPDEFKESEEASFKTSVFSSHQYLLKMSMREPPAIQPGNGTQMLSTLKLDLELATRQDELHTKSGPRFRQSLEKIALKIGVALKIKTFYATAPIYTLPGKALATEQSPLNLKEDLLEMAVVKQKPDHWHFLPNYVDERVGEARPPQQAPAAPECTFCVDNVKHIVLRPSSYHPPGIWTASVEIPLQVSADLPSTFCSAIAARQYSLVANIKVLRARFKPTELEVPLQIVYPSPDHPLGAGAGGEDEEVAGLAQTASNADVLEADQLAADEPPRYF